MNVLTGDFRNRGKSFVLTERLYLNHSRDKAVKPGSLDAAFLLGTVGQEIPEAQARMLGLLDRPVVAPVAGPEQIESRETRVPKNLTRR